MEVDRFVRYLNSQKVYYVNFTIQWRNLEFDPSIYPPIESGEVALTYYQSFDGEAAEPVRKDINIINNKLFLKVMIF